MYSEYELQETFEKTVIYDNKVNGSSTFLSKGLYINYLRELFKVVDRNRVLVVDGDYYQTHPVPILKNIESFLGLTPYFTDSHFQLDSSQKFYCPSIRTRPDKVCLTKVNKTKGRDHPDVGEEVMRKLREFYKPYNQQLQEYLNQTFVWA